MARASRSVADVTDAPSPQTVGALALEGDAVAAACGPYDEDDLDPEITDAFGLVDFGAIRVPVPAGGTVVIEPAESGHPQAVHIALPQGRLSVSALAAPRSQKLWPDLATEIDASLREGGARVRSFQGDWGRELHARTGGATSVFVGVDGPRWMLYGVATGPTEDHAALDAELRRMLRATVVVRGRSPYPPRTVLPLVLPPELAPPAGAAEVDESPAGDGHAAATPAHDPFEAPVTEPVPMAYAAPAPAQPGPASPAVPPAGFPDLDAPTEPLRLVPGDVEATVVIESNQLAPPARVAPAGPEGTGEYVGRRRAPEPTPMASTGPGEYVGRRRRPDPDAAPSPVQASGEYVGRRRAPEPAAPGGPAEYVGRRRKPEPVESHPAHIEVQGVPDAPRPRHRRAERPDDTAVPVTELLARHAATLEAARARGGGRRRRAEP